MCPGSYETLKDHIGHHDPEDEELLRFDVSRKNGEEWEAIDDASYCTQMPVGTPKKILKKALQYIMVMIGSRASSGLSIKKLCEELSWLGPNSKSLE